MEQKNYLKLIWMVAFIAFAAVSCWATDTVSLSVSERSFKKRDPSLWTSPEKFVVLGDQT